MDKKEVLLAFDLSTVTIGYSIFDLETRELIKIDYKKYLSKDKDESRELIYKGFELKTFIKELFFEYNIKEFVIESRLKSFSDGGTNSSAMLKTTSLNYLCQFLISDIYNIIPTEINVNHARSIFYPSFHKIIRKMKGVKGKDFIFEIVKKELVHIKFPTKILKSGTRKGMEIYLEEAKDMTDSYVLGKAWLIENKRA